MFNFIKKKDANWEFTDEDHQNYLLILNKLFQCLQKSNNLGQAQVIQQLIDLVQQGDKSQFVKLINGVDMWGGAGAVWEVFIENKAEALEFEKEMIKLINLMEKTKVLRKGIKPIKKIFENNMK